MLKQKQTIQTKKENPKKKFRFWKYVALIILILLFVVAYIIWLLMQMPNVADIRVGIKEENADIIKNKEQKLYKGKYLSFSYPGNYQELTHETLDDRPVKEIFSFLRRIWKGKK